MKPLTESQREARRLRGRRQNARLKAEVEAVRQARAEQQPVPTVEVPLLRPARADEQFETSTFCGQTIKVLRVSSQPQS